MDGNINTSGFEEMINQSFKELDRIRLAELNSLLKIRESKDRQLEREYDRLFRKYGKDHPLTLRTKEKINCIEFDLVQIKHEIRYAQPQPIQVKPRIYYIEGYLYENAVPIARQSITMFDNNGNKINGQTAAKTDEKGYFVLEAQSSKDFPKSVRMGISSTKMSEQIFKPHEGRVDFVEFSMEDFKPFEPYKPAANYKERDLAKAWLIKGKITDSKNEGLEGLTVKIYDKDIFDDDCLSETKTSKNGIYEVNFPKEKFSDFFENYPEIYLVVENEKGERLHDGRSETNYGAGYIELKDVQIENKEDDKEKQKER